MVGTDETGLDTTGRAVLSEAPCVDYSHLFEWLIFQVWCQTVPKLCPNGAKMVPDLVKKSIKYLGLGILLFFGQNPVQFCHNFGTSLAPFGPNLENIS